MLLTMDATDRGGSVALSDDSRLLELRYEDSRRTHTDRVMPVIDQVLSKHNRTYADIEGIVVAIGPGSFTAVRLAVTTAKTLAMVCEARVLGISSLRAQAEFSRTHSGQIRSVIDARRDQVYLQDFEQRDSGGLSAPSEPEVRDSDLLLEGLNPANNPRLLIRSRSSELPESVDGVSVGSEWMCRPLALALTAIGQRRSTEQWDDVDGLAPLYLRSPDARRSKAKEKAK